MGTSQSREDYITDTDEEEQEESSENDQYDDAEGTHETTQSTSSSSSSSSGTQKKSLDEIDKRLKSLKLKYPISNPNPNPNPNFKNPVKLYLHIGGNTPKAKWIISDKLVSYNFVKSEDDDDGDDDDASSSFWVLKIGSKVRARVSTEMQLKMFGDQRRVDFVNNGVWALKFFTDEEYRKFVTQFQDCLFENVYGVDATEENKLKIYGKDFIGWVKPEDADDSMWEDAYNDMVKSPKETVKGNQGLMEEFEEAANGGVQSLSLGALDNSFLVNDLGVQVYRNFNNGIHGKGVCVKFDSGSLKG